MKPSTQKPSTQIRVPKILNERLQGVLKKAGNRQSLSSVAARLLGESLNFIETATRDYSLLETANTLRDELHAETGPSLLRVAEAPSAYPSAKRIEDINERLQALETLLAPKSRKRST